MVPLNTFSKAALQKLQAEALPRAAGGEKRRENAKLCTSVIASAAKQSRAQRKEKNGLLRCARNDGLKVR
jgi:hypothetical protein